MKTENRKRSGFRGLGAGKLGTGIVTKIGKQKQKTETGGEIDFKSRRPHSKPALGFGLSTASLRAYE
jgi:hypothetical protein